jgi:two-component system, chemotaxis family, response regulator WspF
MKIGIVHHLNEQRERLRDVIHELSDHLVVWTTNYGQHAVELAGKEKPDLILLDIQVADLDGIQVTKDLMTNTDSPILLVTHDIGKNSSLIFEAMSHGALDVAVVPEIGKDKEYSSLIQKIRQMSMLFEPEKIARSKAEFKELKTAPGKGAPIIAIGASTGGPLAVASIISSFPSNLNAPVVIIQHVDDKFITGIVDWLAKRSHLPVQLIERETEPKPGVVYVSGSTWHLRVTPDGRLAYTSQPDYTPYRPSIDIFFESLAKYWPNPSIAVLLTGMGSDGAKGLKTLKNQGWYTIAEDEETCAVYGMPKAAAELGAACDVLKLTDIPLAILSRLKKRKLIV